MFPLRPYTHDTQNVGVPTPYNNPNVPDNFVLNSFAEGREGFLPTTSNQRERLIPFGTQENEEKIKNDGVSNVRKFVHRETERQRRQEMGNLCRSLRGLLPFEYVKGKRSTSDHVQEAVNYIKDMKNNIHQLKSQREKLETLPNSGNSSHIHGDNNLPAYVTVNPCHNGVEILINTIFDEEQGFSLSRILTKLHEEGFNLVNCLSKRAGERSLHRIQLEASDPTLDVLSGLQQRLTYMINFPR